jgi:AraC-like DNA-binding protein
VTTEAGTLAVEVSARDMPWDVRTSDLAWVRREIGRFLKPFCLSAHAQQRYDARLIHRRLRRVELTVIEYGGEVAVDAGRMGRCYLVQIPLQGSYTVLSDERPLQVNTRWAHVVYPGMPLDMAWSGDCRLLVLRLEEAMIGECRTRLFPGLISLDAEPNRSLARIIDYVTLEATLGNLFTSTPHVAAYAENLILAGLMSTFQSSQLSADQDAAPVYVRRARRFILERLAENLTVTQIARAASASKRTLFEGFQRTHGMGPLAWMRAQRLDRARSDLLAAQAGEVRVTDVALRWGFPHIGRFSIAYRQCFGETPTATLHRER